jgi:hypothetical protein
MLAKYFIVNFKSLFNAWPSSLQTAKFIANCQLTFQVQKLGAETSQHLFQVEINNSMQSSWSSGLPGRFVFHWIGYYHWVWTFVYKRSSNIEMNLQTLLRSSRPISELGNVIGKFATNLGTHVEKWLEIDNVSWM